MIKVTNKHAGMLNIAGQDARPGATVAVEDKAFEAWSKGNGAKTWIKMKLVVVEGQQVAAKTEPATVDPVANTTEDLKARATKLGITFNEDISDDDLLNEVLAAEQQADQIAANASEDERLALLEEARALGLNPNKNTGIEKLKKQIADKKAV